MTVGDFDVAYENLSEPERAALWRQRGGAPFPGPVGRVRRLARIVPRDIHTLPCRVPALFTMDGTGIYFGDDAPGLWRIFGGRCWATRLLWGRVLMRGCPRILTADVALGRTSLVRDQVGIDAALHVLAGWLRLPGPTPARLYFGWRRRWLRLDTYEVHGVKLLPRHGRYTIVRDPRRILWRAGYRSLEPCLAET